MSVHTSKASFFLILDLYSTRVDFEEPNLEKSAVKA
jgi:hypothetical protein